MSACGWYEQDVIDAFFLKHNIKVPHEELYELKKAVSAMRVQTEEERDRMACEVIDAECRTINRLAEELYDVLFDGELEDEREVRWTWVSLEVRRLKEENDALKKQLETIKA